MEKTSSGTVIILWYT